MAAHGPHAAPPPPVGFGALTVRRLGLLIVVLAVAGAAPPSVPVYKELGDWVSACDNVRSCSARAVPDPSRPSPAASSGDDQESLGLWIRRDAGGDAAPRLELSGDHLAIPLSLAIDGQDQPGALPWVVDKTVGETLLRLSGGAAQALIGRLRDAKLLTVTQDGRPVPISLAGLAATLLVFDDVQGRIGTGTALVRPGPRPATDVPPAPPLPIVRAAPTPPPLPDAKAVAAAVRRAQAAALKALDCDQDVADDDDAEPLDADEAIVILVCTRAAYQEDSLVFRTPRNAPARARLVHVSPPPGAARMTDTDGEMVGVSYDPAKSVLSEFDKGRGLTDCGGTGEWTFDGQGFQPSRYTSQDRCGGEPGDWPVIYRTRTVR